MLPLGNVIQDAFSPLITAFEAILVFLHNSVLGGSWGLSIIGLTVIVRAALVPLTLSQFRSMQEMQRHAPELKAIQQKYKEDKQRQQQELMKFYKENKINPFASCIPLLLQLPVFISLFYMLRTNLKLDICGKALKSHFGVSTTSEITKHFSKQLSSTSCDQVAHHSAKFLFIPDITHPASGVVLAVLILLYIASQLGSTLLMSATADKNQRRMMLALPFVFTLFIIRFPGGLLVYWITTNLWTIGQQYFVRRRVGPPPVPGGGAGGKAPDDGKGPGGDGRGPGGPRAGGPSGGRREEPELAGVGAGRRTAAAPPPPPRKRKKRSGRRR